MSSSEAARIPIFAALSPKDRDKVLGSAIQRTYAPGATLVKEGETSMNLFFIVSGTAEVATAEEGHRRTLGPGDFFGELGLVERHARTATVTAGSEVTVVMLSPGSSATCSPSIPSWPCRWSTGWWGASTASSPTTTSTPTTRPPTRAEREADQARRPAPAEASTGNTRGVRPVRAG